MRTVFNAPPGWPVPQPGWSPGPGWRPDPAWPAPPPGWVFHLPAPVDAVAEVYRRRATVLLVLGAALTGLGAAAAAAALLDGTFPGGTAGLATAAAGLLVLGLLYVAGGVLVGLTAPARAARLVARRDAVVVATGTGARRSPGWSGGPSGADGR